MNLELIAKSENSKIQKELIYKIKELINYKNLEPADKLPSERMMSEKFGVSRSNLIDTFSPVREDFLSGGGVSYFGDKQS